MLISTLLTSERLIPPLFASPACQDDHTLFVRCFIPARTELRHEVGAGAFDCLVAVEVVQLGTGEHDPARTPWGNTFTKTLMSSLRVVVGTSTSQLLPRKVLLACFSRFPCGGQQDEKLGTNRIMVSHATAPNLLEDAHDTAGPRGAAFRQTVEVHLPLGDDMHKRNI